jgi:hypothetical protein
MSHIKRADVSPGMAFRLYQSHSGPWIVAMVAVVATVILLKSFGRLWWCACNQFALWSPDAYGPHNSQHLFDPYAFTHVEHGFLFFGLLWWIAPNMKYPWRFCWSVVIECLWESLENSSIVIERFRAATAAQGYTGDTVVNVIGDVVACGAGFWIAGRIGFRWTLLLAVILEVGLLFTIRDNLLLNVVMLFWPIEAIKNWQLG